MALGLVCLETLDDDGHQYRIADPTDTPRFLSEVAEEYRELRTQAAIPIQDIELDGIDILDTATIRRHLQESTIPEAGSGHLDVVRSDFGEVIAYLILEHEYGTRLGYKSVRDRELTQQTGRGIDAVGVENGNPITVVLGEVKVSDETRTPPQVVDTARDSLRKQHRAHLKENEATGKKLWDLGRKTTDTQLRDHIWAAAFLIKEGKLDRVRLIAFSVLVRSKERYAEGDFGSFKWKPQDFQPAVIRFWIVRTEESIETTVQQWHSVVTAEGGST